MLSCWRQLWNYFDHKLLTIIHSTTFSKSSSVFTESEKTTTGLLPPNSIVVGFRFCMADKPILRPVATLPVNETFDTFVLALQEKKYCLKNNPLCALSKEHTWTWPATLQKPRIKWRKYKVLKYCVHKEVTPRAIYDLVSCKYIKVLLHVFLCLGVWWFSLDTDKSQKKRQEASLAVLMSENYVFARKGCYI